MASSASASATAAALFSSDGVPAFVPTTQWTTILPGQTVPPGLWMRMDVATGARMARLMPQPGERVEGGEQAIASSAEDAQRATGGVRDDAFDDSMPSATEGNTPDAFFAVWTPVFERNSKFSKRTPVPRLGDMHSSDAAVKAFYEFWSGFSSCREFAPELLQPTDAAALTRTQLQKEMHKKAQAARHNDSTRVRQMVAAAEAKDPRVARIRREEKEASEANEEQRRKQQAEKEAAERESIAAAAAAKDAAERARIAEAVALAERESAARAAEDESRKQAREGVKKLRATFGKACKNAGLDEIHTDLLRAVLKPDQLQTMVDAFAADETAKAKQLYAEHLAPLLAAEQAAAEERARVAAAAAAAKKERDAVKLWSPEQEAALLAAVAQVPKGTELRWHKLTDLVNAAAGHPRDIADVMQRARALESAQLQQWNQKAAAGGEDAEGAAAIASSTAVSSASAASSSPPPSLSPVIPSPSPSPSPTAVASLSSSSPSSLGEFSVVEQMRLESALQSVSRTAPDRWDQIAAVVGTKTREQCIARYKQIVALIKAQAVGKR